jgi:O-antigen/teichoic acid export membrane protein
MRVVLFANIIDRLYPLGMQILRPRLGVASGRFALRRWIPLLLIPILLLAIPIPADASAAVRVFIAGESSTVRPALELAGSDAFIIVDNIENADVLLLNGTIPDADSIRARLGKGAGLVLILGPNISPASFTGACGVIVAFQQSDLPASPVEVPIADPIGRQIVWNGSPQVRQRSLVETPISSVQPLVTGYEDGSWLIWSLPGGRAFIVNIFLGKDDNPQFREWAYYNYLIYHLAARAGGRTPLDFADYPGSPVPHAAERNGLLIAMAFLVAAAFTAFYFVRRYSLRHPEALDAIMLYTTPIPSPKGAGAPAAEEKSAAAWEQIGFQRPLSGFLVSFSLALIFFIPLILYQNLILPTYILPSAQALGIWGRVTQFFNVAWYFFDMGTSVAFIKYLSQYRVHDPKRGIQYGQLFVWWQILSGAVQVALVIAFASAVAPKSAYALYAWSMIIHATIQLPGFYQVMRHALSGFQRQDAARILDVSVNVVMPIFVQPIFVTIFYLWGRANPVFGGAMGGLLGLGVAAYAAELFTFLLGWVLYRRLGYNIRVLFLAHFDWEIIRKGFGFGIFEMLASAAWSAGQAAEIWVTQSRLVNYAEIWGNWVLAQNFIFSYQILQMLTEGVMPAISEAISHGKRILSQYYSVMSYKWGGLVSAFIGAVLLAVAPSFLLGATGAEFHRSALYVVPLAVWGAFQYFSWVGDAVQLGSNKPSIKMLLTFGEQIVRVLLILLLLERFQVSALIVAYLIALLGKGTATFLVNHKICFPQKIYIYQSLVAPFLAGMAHYLLLHGVALLIWRGDQVTSVLLFFLAILPSLPAYLFFYGLAGGWDEATLNELKQSVEMTGAMRPLVWVIWASTAAGARLSPLHGRFPIRIRPAALEEARALTLEKVSL